MNVVFEGFDIGNIHGFAGRRAWKHLHDSDGSGGTSGVMIKFRFLIGLGRDRQPVKFVLIPVFFKELNKPIKFFSFLRLQGILDPFAVLIIPFKQDIPDQCSLFIAL